MAFYLALFNVNHVSDEVKHTVSHARRSKSVKPVLKDKNRRHSLSSTQEVADYRLLPRPRIIGSSHNLRKSPSPPPPHRRTSGADTTLCTCDTDSPENGRKKVTFDGEEGSMLTVQRPRRKLSEGSFLGNLGALNRSSSSILQPPHPTEMEELSNQRVADLNWIYSINLQQQQQKKDHRRLSQQEKGLLDNGNQIIPFTSTTTTAATATTSITNTISETPPPLPTQTPTALPSPGPSIVLPIQCDHCRNVNGHCGIGCVPSSNVEPLIQKRPQSKLPSILRRRSTSDRSASLSVVFRRAMPNRSASPNHFQHQQKNIGGIEGIKRTQPTKLRSHIYTQQHQHQLHSDNIPLIDKERNEMIRSNYY